MTETNADVLRRVLAQIAAQRSNLHEGGSRQEHADRYHEQLDRLDAAGYDVAEFRLNPDRDLFYRSAGYNPREGQKYEKTKSVRLGVLEAKMDAILSYFQLDAEKAPIGFDVPRKR
jgi:hypothetical protein